MKETLDIVHFQPVIKVVSRVNNIRTSQELLEIKKDLYCVPELHKSKLHPSAKSKFLKHRRKEAEAPCERARPPTGIPVREEERPGRGEQPAAGTGFYSVPQGRPHWPNGPGKPLQELPQSWAPRHRGRADARFQPAHLPVLSEHLKPRLGALQRPFCTPASQQAGGKVPERIQTKRLVPGASGDSAPEEMVKPTHKSHYVQCKAGNGVVMTRNSVLVVPAAH